MDKPQPPKHRKGVALLITLVTISMIIVIIGTLLSTLDSVRKDSKETTALLQANTYYSDIAILLRDFEEKKMLFQTLYQTPIPFMSEDGTFSIIVHCKPLLAGVNINWLGAEQDSKMYPKYAITQNIFDAIAAEYSLEDPGLLLEMLLQEIGDQGKFVQKPQSRLFQKRGIISLHQFETIVGRYQMEADDPGASRVPWDRFFSFVPDAEVIDGDYMSAELVSLLFEIDLSVVQDEWQPGEGALAKFRLTYGLDYESKIFASKFIEYAQCEVGYDYAQERYTFSFVDMEGEVKHFEFYGRQ